MSLTSVANQLCVFFGGAYDASTHTYRTPQFTVAGSSPVVRRAAPHFDNHQDDYWASPLPGEPYGILIMIFLEEGGDIRVAPGQPGLREVHHRAVMNVFMKTLSEKAEDLQDAQYLLVDAIRGRLYTDRTAGSGGFEAGYNGQGQTIGFQVGEVSPGQSWFRWKMYPIETTMKGSSKTSVYIEFDAVEYQQA